MKKGKIIDKEKTQDFFKEIKGVGPKREKDLALLGLTEPANFFSYFPRSYEDRSLLDSFNKLLNNEVQTIRGTIKKVEIVRPKKNISLFKVHLTDILDTGAGTVIAVWFNQVFLKNQLKEGMEIIVTGKVDLRFERQIIVNDYELLTTGADKLHGTKIIPIYSASEEITSKFLRGIIVQILKKYLPTLKETLNSTIIEKYQLLNLDVALEQIHFPSNWEMLNKARYRLIFEELLVLQLAMQCSRQKIVNRVGISHTKDEKLTDKLIQSLTYDLTKAQIQVIKEIEKDMLQSTVMHRLIQGDVGSGKTIVAVWTLVKALSGGYQGAFMAPTEILAEQHYLNLTKILEPLDIKPILLTGSLTLAERKERLRRIAHGEHLLVIGTHALIQEEVRFHNLGVVIIDEQHRFGVKERLTLTEKGTNPDVLIMTATPIPRSLALTLYGDLDLSIIDEIPTGRKPVRTHHVSEKMRPKVYNLINREMKNGFQIYIVCPLIAESEKLDLENVFNLAESLKKVFPPDKIAILHGRMGMAEKEEIMANFRSGQTPILISTTVIEVGIDVPTATVMIIENAERFGLAQLHQLRGRVGRGEQQGYCILISEPTTEKGKARMKVMTQSSDGFYLAEEDLKIRGPGEILGIKQHGLLDLKIADLVRDIKILNETKKLAQKIVAEGLDLPKYQELNKAVEKLNKLISLANQH